MPKTCLILLALLVNATVGVLAPNIVSSVAATILFLLSVAFLFRAEPIAVWLLLPFVWLQFTVLLSLNFAEGGATMPEMGEGGGPSTAAVSYGLYSLLLVVTAVGARRWLGRRFVVPHGGRARPDAKRPFSLLDVGLLCLAAGAGIYLLVAGLRTGFPLLTHTDRFMYRRLDASVVTVDILDLQLLPALALGVGRLTTSSAFLRRVYVGLFMLLLMDSALFGDKFTILLMSLLAFVTPGMIEAPDAMIRTGLRFLPAFGLVALLMTGATLFIYSDYGALRLPDTLLLIGDRISGQGQLWYVTVQHDAAFLRFDTKSVGGVLASVVYKNPADYMFRHRLGPYAFVQAYAPALKYQAVLHDEGSVTPTMGFEAYGLALFGYAGLLVQVVASGVALAVLAVFIERALRSGNPLRALFPAFLLNGSLKLFAQGTLFNVCSVPMVKSYAAFILFEIVVAILARSAPPPRQAPGIAARREESLA